MGAFFLCVTAVSSGGSLISHASEPSSQQVKASKASGFRYLLYRPSRQESSPAGVRAAPLERSPLVLFLHGGGEGGAEIERVKRHGLPRLIAAGRDSPFFVVSPQNPSRTQFWDDQRLIRLVDELLLELPIDRRRIYLTGMSRGGFGAWRLAIQNPDRFAALVTVCGGGSSPDAGRLRDVPTWVFNGGKDPLIPADESRRMVAAMRRAGAEVRLTIYPEAEHDVWTHVYRDPSLYRWMMQQQRELATGGRHRTAAGSEATPDVQ